MSIVSSWKRKKKISLHSPQGDRQEEASTKAFGGLKCKWQAFAEGHVDTMQHFGKETVRKGTEQSSGWVGGGGQTGQ